MPSRILSISVLMIGLASMSACMPQGTTPPSPQACTDDAMLCPDGSAVLRTGPNCTFAECPNALSSSTGNIQEKGILQGTMTIGPICPVEEEGNPCKPTPEMYKEHPVFIYASTNTTEPIAVLTPDADGQFSVKLPAGTYLIDTEHSAVGSVQGAPVTVTILLEQVVSISIDIDTGIR